MIDDTKKPKRTPHSSAEDRLAKEIGQRILEARNGLGWSQQALQNRSKMADPDQRGISRAVLSLYETGGSKPGAREIMLLCEALKVTPNWLIYGTDTPARALQASMDFLRGSELQLSVRLAFAMIALDSVEREAFATLLFSSLTKKMGDVELSALMTFANMESDAILAKVVEATGGDTKGTPLAELLADYVAMLTEGAYSNYGNLRPLLTEEQMAEGVVPAPRELGGSKSK